MKYESDFRLVVVKKCFHNGFEDKTSNFLPRGFVRNAKSQIVSELTFIPKIEKDSNIIKISKQRKVNLYLA